MMLRVLVTLTLATLAASSSSPINHQLIANTHTTSASPAAPLVSGAPPTVPGSIPGAIVVVTATGGGGRGVATGEEGGGVPEIKDTTQDAPTEATTRSSEEASLSAVEASAATVGVGVALTDQRRHIDERINSQSEVSTSPALEASLSDSQDVEVMEDMREVAEVSSGTPRATSPVQPVQPITELHQPSTLEPSTAKTLLPLEADSLLIQDEQESEVPLGAPTERQEQKTPVHQQPKEPEASLTRPVDQQEKPTVRPTQSDAAEYKENAKKPTLMFKEKKEQRLVVPTMKKQQTPASQLESTASSRDLQPLPPPLPQNYAARLDVWDGSRHFTVLERKEESRLALTLSHGGSRRQAEQTCLVNLTSGTGHVIRGVKCHVSTSLPHACFCSESQCAAYVRYAAVLAFVASGAAAGDANRTTVQAVGVGAVEMLSWRRRDADMSVEMTYVRSEDHGLVPVAVSLEGSGRVFGLPGGFVQLVYSVLSFRAGDGGAWNRAGSPFLPPPGVFCPPMGQTGRGPRLPPLAEQFSVSMETIVHNSRLISYEQQHYDLVEKLVAYQWRPHLHSPPTVNFASFPPAQTLLPPESFRIVHDFKTGVQYRISEETGNCTVEGIPLDAPDAALTTATRHVRLRHAQELLHADRDSFAYWGMREVRGVLCDVWVASRGTQRGYYSTVEVFLSHKNWSVEMEVLNHVQRVPIGVATYLTPAQDSTASSTYQHVATTHYFAYRTGHPAWSNFEIAPCLNRMNRLFLKLNLQVTYRELAQFNMEAARDSLRRAIAGIAGVSPLRVTQLTLSSEGATGGEVGVWFLLLEAAGMLGPVDQPRMQLTLADAYQLLRGIIQRHPVPVRLGLGGGRQRVVQIRAGSLTAVPEAMHPGGALGSAARRRYLHATYTAGSMAGLGLAMVVLGLCIGLLSGFLLWKRRVGVPYELAE